jgi:hypothetical protein
MLAARGSNLNVGPTKGGCIPKGSTVFCPGCGTGMYVTLERVTEREIRNIRFFEPVTEHAEEHTDERYPFECQTCKRLIVSNYGQFLFKVKRSTSF